jgi:serine/threonine protein kinase
MEQANQIIQITEDNENVVWERGEVIGIGGFAMIYKFNKQDKPKEIYVAKVANLLFKNKAHRLHKETLIHKNLNHPNIITFISAFTTLNHSIIIMEYTPEKDLQKIIQSRHYKKKLENNNDDNNNYLFPFPEIKDAMNQIIAGLEYLHENSIVHRDVKPENVLMFRTETNSRIFKLCDFGLSVKILTEECLEEIGTPLYRPPELIGGVDMVYYVHQTKPISPKRLEKYKEQCFKVDVWSLTVLFCYLLTGIEPFYGNNVSIVNDKITTFKYVLPNFVSDGIKNLVKRVFVPEIGRINLKQFKDELAAIEI